MTEQLASIDGVTLVTEPDPRRRAGLARIVVAGHAGTELTKILRDGFGFWIYGNFPGALDGVYVSPNVFNTPHDMDRFASALQTIAA